MLIVLFVFYLQIMIKKTFVKIVLEIKMMYKSLFFHNLQNYYKIINLLNYSKKKLLLGS